jgi:hypothetical protein
MLPPQVLPELLFDRSHAHTHSAWGTKFPVTHNSHQQVRHLPMDHRRTGPSVGHIVNGTSRLDGKAVHFLRPNTWFLQENRRNGRHGAASPHKGVASPQTSRREHTGGKYLYQGDVLFLSVCTFRCLCALVCVCSGPRVVLSGIATNGTYVHFYVHSYVHMECQKSMAGHSRKQMTAKTLPLGKCCGE